MTYPLPSLLRLAARWLPPELVPAPALARIQGLARRLPRAYSVGTLECRLRGEAPVDFAVCLDDVPEQKQALAELLSRPDAADEADPGADPGLAASRALLEAWLRPGSAVHAEVPWIWIECDVGAARTESFPFIAVEPQSGLALPALAQTLALTAEIFRLLRGTAAPPPALAALATCISRLPCGGLARHVAVMPHRGSTDLRLHFSIPFPRVRDWLLAIGWPGSQPELDRALALCGTGFEHIGVQVSAGDGLTSYLGLELCHNHGPQQTPAWSELLANLVAADLCDPARARAAYDFWGEEPLDPPDAEWRLNVYRHIYVKLCLQPDGRREAKCYLNLVPRYVLF